jgi:hypothetical protein
MEQNPGTTSRLNVAVVVALIPGFSYFVTFVYEFRYCSHFNIPISLISPNIDTVLVFMVALVVFSFSMITVVGIFFSLFKNLSRDPKMYPYHSLLAVNIVLSVFIAILAHVYEWEFTFVLLLFGILMAWNLLILGFGFVLSRWKKKDLPDAVDIVGKKLVVDAAEVYAWFLPLLQEGEKSLLILCFTILGLALILGDAHAKRTKEFLVLTDRPHTVLLRTYGSLLICSSYDSTTKTIGNDFILLQKDKLPELHLRNQSIGPLYPRTQIHVVPTQPRSILGNDSVSPPLEMDTNVANATPRRQ